MSRQAAMFALAVVATVLVAAGFSWKWLHPPESYWSEEKAQSYVDAFTAVHAAEDGLLHEPSDSGAAAYRAALLRYDTLQNELDQARSARDRTGTYFVLAGLAFLVAAYGLWRFYAEAPDEKTG
jgi:hypothetical protein